MGNVAKRPDGTWRARYRDLDGKEHAKHFRLKRDADAWVEDQESDLRRGTYVIPDKGKVTFGEWFRTWADQQVWAQGTKDMADVTFTSCTFTKMKLMDVKQSHVRAWVKRMDSPTVIGDKTKPGLAPNTIKVRFQMVRAAFAAAAADHMVASNPTDGVKLPRVRRRDASMFLFTSEQIRNAMDAAEPSFRAFIAVGAFAGLRLGEIAGLQVADVDFLRGTITVRRNVQGSTKAETRVVPPKHGSERVVYVPRELTDLLAAHIRDHGTIKSEAWIFHTFGHVFNRNSAGDRWRTVRRTAGLPEEATLHDLRHYYASGLIASGCDVVTVQRALGHSVPSITLNTYSHLWPSAEDTTRAAASGLMTAALGDSADRLRTDGGVEGSGSA